MKRPLLLDNSNLAESYSGTTTPLTYSFARSAYAEVYRHFCRIMGVSERVIRENDEMFPNMLAFVGCRMYYRLFNWYRLISFMPGYRFNHSFFEKMLGVEVTNAPLAQPTSAFTRYVIDLPRVLWQTLGILFTFFRMGTLVHSFNRSFDEQFQALDTRPFSNDPRALMKDYDVLHRMLTEAWRVPIANDFAVMVSTGILSKLAPRFGIEDPYQLLAPRIRQACISLDPKEMLAEIRTAITKEPLVRSLFELETDEERLLMHLRGQFRTSMTTALFEKYLNRFGARVPNELKLESETLTENPHLLLRIMQQMLSKPAESTIGPSAVLDVPLLLRPIASWAYHSILRREETRFRRTLIFGYARRLFLQLGKAFRQKGIWRTERDIFYLEIPEIRALAENRISPERVRVLIKERKARETAWRGADLPRRIESEVDDIPAIEARYRIAPARRRQKRSALRSLRGHTASLGGRERLFGEALVMPVFDPSADFRGKILVTSFTDPGWTIVFPLIKGLVVERGGRLSHAAVVAREMNIPCIIGVSEATRLIPQRASLTLNLTHGEVIIS